MKLINGASLPNGSLRTLGLLQSNAICEYIEIELPLIRCNTKHFLNQVIYISPHFFEEYTQLEKVGIDSKKNIVFIRDREGLLGQ